MSFLVYDSYTILPLTACQLIFFSIQCTYMYRYEYAMSNESEVGGKSALLVVWLFFGIHSEFEIERGAIRHRGPSLPPPPPSTSRQDKGRGRVSPIMDWHVCVYIWSKIKRALRHFHREHRGQWVETFILLFLMFIVHCFCCFCSFVVCKFCSVCNL